MTDTSGDGCWFCADDRGTDAPPGGWLYEDAHWRAGHAPAQFGPAGLVVLESRRHVLDVSELDAAEAAGYGAVLGLLTGVVKEVVGAERVYTWASAAFTPHLHVWVLPWRPDQPVGPAFLARTHKFACTAAEAERTALALRAALAGRPA
ncbi:HIT family protein [Longispora urticae]